MSDIKPYIIVVLICVFSLPVKGQQKSLTEIIEAIIESTLDKQESAADINMLIQDLEDLAENPININSTTKEDLKRLHILNEVQITKLFKHIEEFGPVYSIYQLNTIDSYSRDLLEKIQPFISFGKPEQKDQSLREQLKYGRHQLLIRSLGVLQKARGYKANDENLTPYAGNRVKHYLRYKFESREKIKMGFTAEKDPGEAFFKAPNSKGYDFYSAYLKLSPNGKIKQIILGDFVVRNGQGLALWQGYTSGKSDNVTDIFKTGQSIRPYTSVDENNFFRGVAIHTELGNAEFSIFYSRNKVDGNLQSQDSTSTSFTSLQTSGYHRTANEIEDKNSISDINTGTILSWTFNSLKINSSFAYQKFDKHLLPNYQLYKQFRFKGKDNFTASVDYIFNKSNYLLFGEAAISKSNGKAITQGIVVHINDQLGISSLFRHFDINYQALWANTFAEGSNVSNENGIYLGLKFLPAKRLSLLAYSDFYRHRWVNYTTAGPSIGYDIFAQAHFQFNKDISCYIRYKSEKKDKKTKASNLYINSPEHLQKLRLNTTYSLHKKLKLKTRLEMVNYKGQQKETGFLLFQDFQYAPSKLPLNITTRLAWFYTDGYNSRIYAYENDLLYSFAIPAYFGKGFRTYLNMKFKISDKIECWMKLANSHWNDRQTISSGYNEITGSNKTELKFQLRLKF